MWFIRRMRISWTERKSNKQVLKEAYLERSLIKTIRQRQLRFLSHICRHKSLEHSAITEKIEDKRSRAKLAPLYRLLQKDGERWGDGQRKSKSVFDQSL
ncbi:endonuclease-reverse transcriptase [Plakobranchus ocellatus]|uniref:Endonuclease-reverse transcriptase n=1 Tax=Plakobranchus ocellatus TaxID=259542 RepID=A0AAV4CC95_9GAST|nr:endonuclease-reverse transcriptase [Plakobranchus ocellatus]